MTNFLIKSFAWAAAILAVAPVMTFLHELAHARVAHYFTRLPVAIRMGIYTSPFARVQWGWLKIEISFPWLSGRVNADGYRWLTPFQRMITAGVAPLTSFVLLILMCILAYTSLNSDHFWRMIIQYSAICVFLEVLFTTIPIRYPKWFPGHGWNTSDGYKVLKHWQLYRTQINTKPSLKS